MCEWALLSKPTTILRLLDQAFWRMPFFTEWSCASSSEVVLARQSSHFPTWASASGTSGSRWFSLILLHERIRRRVRLCRFCTLRLWSSRSSPASAQFRGAPRSDHLSTRVRFVAMAARVFTGPSASRNTFSVSTITDGNARVGGRSTLSTLTLAWLYIEPSPCGGVRPAGDRVDSDPGAVFEDDLHPRTAAGRPLEPWVCHHTREPTVLSRVSCSPPHLNFDRFHQPCLFP